MSLESQLQDLNDSACAVYDKLTLSKGGWEFIKAVNKVRDGRTLDIVLKQAAILVTASQLEERK